MLRVALLTPPALTSASLFLLPFARSCTFNMSTRPHRTTRSSAAAAQAAPPAPTTTRSRKPSTVEAPSTASTTTTATRKVPLPWNSSAAPDTKTTRTAATKPAARPLWNQTKLNSTTDASSSNTPQRRPNSALSNNKTLNNGTPTLTKQSSNAMLAPPTERKRTLSTASIDSVVEPPTPNFRAVDGEKQGMENYDPAREPIKVSFGDVEEVIDASLTAWYRCRPTSVFDLLQLARPLRTTSKSSTRAKSLWSLLQYVHRSIRASRTS